MGLSNTQYRDIMYKYDQLRLKINALLLRDMRSSMKKFRN